MSEDVLDAVILIASSFSVLVIVGAGVYYLWKRSKKRKRKKGRYID